jgi:predicted metal-dependent hydrolase
MFFAIKKKRNTRARYLRHKEQARALVHERIRFYNQFYNFRFNRIAIKNTKSMWGSCSAKGNLNFNYRIVFLPPPLADYLIVHELCHLYEFNHSKRFWNLVAATIPAYKELRKELKKTSFHIL